MPANYNTLHPWYEKRETVWQFNEDHYDGGRVLVESTSVADYLPSFRVEDGESYEKRKIRSRGLYDNIVKRAISVYTSQVFAVDPNRELPKQLEEMVENIDLHGTNATPFFLRVMELAERNDIAYVLIDSPRAPVATGPDGAKRELTEFDRKRNKLRPWFEKIEATQVIDWDVEKNDTTRLGELNWVVIKDEIHKRAEPFAQADKFTRYRVWTRDEWIIYHDVGGATDSSGNEIGVVEADRGRNMLGEVPLVAFYAKRIGPMRGETIIDEVALTCNAIWNRSSVEDESFHIHGFPQMIFKMGGGRTISELKMAADRGIQIGNDDDAFYPVPPSYSLDAFEKFVMRSVERITDLVFARTSRQLSTRQVQTAEGKNIDRKEFTSLLKTKAGIMEEGESRCWEFAAMLFGGNEAAVNIEYNRDFDVDEDNAAEWEKLVTNHVRSRHEWYISLHPGATKDEASVAIEENRQAEMDRSIEQMGLAFEQAVAEGRNIPGNEPDSDRMMAGGSDGKPPQQKAARNKKGSRRTRREARDSTVGGEEGEAA